MGAKGRTVHHPSETVRLVVRCQDCNWSANSWDVLALVRAHVRANRAHTAYVERTTRAAVTWDGE